MRASQKPMLALINHCLVDDFWLSYRHVKSHIARKYARHSTALHYCVCANVFSVFDECFWCAWLRVPCPMRVYCWQELRCTLLVCSCVCACVCLVMFFFFISRFISNPQVYLSVDVRLFSHFWLSLLCAIVTAAAAPVSMWMCAIELKLSMCHIFAFTHTNGSYGRMSSLYIYTIQVDSFATMYSTIQSSTTERSVQVGTHISSLW